MKVLAAVCCVAGMLGAFSVVEMGCSSPSSGGSRSGVTESKRLLDTTDSDKKALCDWVAGQEGGYGHKETATCGNATVSRTAAPDQATCVASFHIPTGCNVTVQETEDCVQASADLCKVFMSVPAACAALQTPECTGSPPDAGGGQDASGD